MAMIDTVKLYVHFKVISNEHVLSITIQCRMPFQCSFNVHQICLFKTTFTVLY